MPTNDEDAVRRALAMLRNRGVAITIDESEFGSAMRSFTEISKFLIGGIGVAYFYLFIAEETVQTAGFGVFTLMQGKLWREARVQNLRYREMATAGKTMTEIFSLKQDPKISDNYITGALHLLKMPLDFVQNLVKEITGAEQTPTEFVFLPFTLFFEAALATADSYDARIASQISDINPGYKEKVDNIKKTFALEKFKVKMAFDERMDALAVEKKQRLDELSIEVKVEMQKIAAAQRTKEITRAEADKSKLLIEQEKDKIEIALKQEFDEKDRALKEVHFNELALLERVEENRLADAREKQFGTGTPPAALIPPPTTRPPETLQGPVIKIVDGDTFDIPNWRIRIVGINAAESGTQQGTLDKNKLELLIAQKTVTIKIDPDHQFDRFGRVLGVVFVEDTNVNVEMLRSCNAALDLREENKYVDVEAFRAAAQECLAKGAGTTPTQPSVHAPKMPTPKKSIADMQMLISEKNKEATEARDAIFKWEWWIPETGEIKILEGRRAGINLSAGFERWIVADILTGTEFNVDTSELIDVNFIRFEPAAPTAVQKFTITVNVVNLKGEVVPIDDADVTIGGNSLRVQSFPAGTTATVRIRTFGVRYIAPDVVQDIQFVATLDRNLIYDFVVDTKENLQAVISHPLIPSPQLPPDENSITGQPHFVEMGQVRTALGHAEDAEFGRWITPNKREYTIQEITGEFESIGFRLHINGNFQNTTDITIEWDGLDPDGQRIGGLPLVRTIAPPNIAGGYYYTGADFGMNLAGQPREIIKKGIYKTIMRIQNNNVINGAYVWYWSVV